MALKNFSWVLPQMLAGSDLPGSSSGYSSTLALQQDLNYLSTSGVSLLVSLERPAGSVGELCAEVDMQWRYFPIPDYNVPEDLLSFKNLVAAITASITNKKAVCVHCHAGVGRTGLVLCCVMGTYLKLSGKTAIAAVRKVRPILDTNEQERFVTNFLRDYES